MVQQIEQATVPYTVHESDMARSDRNYKRLWLTLNGVLAVIAAVIIAKIIGSLTNETSKRRNN